MIYLFPFLWLLGWLITSVALSTSEDDIEASDWLLNLILWPATLGFIIGSLIRFSTGKQQ